MRRTMSKAWAAFFAALHDLAAENDRGALDADLVALDDGERYAGDLQAAHLPFDVSIDCVTGCVLGDRFGRSRFRE